ncbi:MAG: hypothetical protein JJT95_13275 [Pararhodobacter sp.]|nr:hypothetical protein [Pararhodobacter sp.]
MPNIKFYVDTRNGPGTHETVSGLLPEIRSMICETLEVPRAACQFAVIEVAGLVDQPAINIELQLLSGPARTPEYLRCLGERLRDMLSGPTGLEVAVRMSSLDPVSYVSLK